MSLVLRKPVFGVSDTRSDTNRAVQPHKMARGLKFRIKKVEGLHYLCSENKGDDQLRGHREADLRLCFHICKNPVFSQQGSNSITHKNMAFQTFHKEHTEHHTWKLEMIIKHKLHVCTGIIPLFYVNTGCNIISWNYLISYSYKR